MKCVQCRLQEFVALRISQQCNCHGEGKNNAKNLHFPRTSSAPALMLRCRMRLGYFTMPLHPAHRAPSRIVKAAGLEFS
jgi:hypothetical protein